MKIAYRSVLGTLTLSMFVSSAAMAAPSEVALNPRPLPPGAEEVAELKPQPLPPVDLKPQPLPPEEELLMQLLLLDQFGAFE